MNLDKLFEHGARGNNSPATLETLAAVVKPLVDQITDLKERLTKLEQKEADRA